MTADNEGVTSWEDLQIIIQAYVARALDEVRANIQSWTDVTEAERARALELVDAQVAPIIAAQTRGALVAGWFSLDCPIGRVQ